MWKGVVLMIFSFITLTYSIFNYPKLKMSQEKSAIHLPQQLNENLPPLIFVPSLMGCSLEVKLFIINVFFPKAQLNHANPELKPTNKFA